MKQGNHELTACNTKEETMKNSGLEGAVPKSSVISGEGLTGVGLKIHIPIIVMICIVGIAASCDAQVVTYPTPTGMITSTDFQCMIDGTSVWVERFNVPSRDLRNVGNNETLHVNVVNFSASGQLTVVLTLPVDVTSAVISPKRLGITGSINAKTLTFTFTAPQKLIVSINNDQYSLVILANPLEVNPPKNGDAHVQYWGPGVHDVGTVTLQSNMTYYIAGGAVLNGRMNGRNVQNVKILGRGIIDVGTSRGSAIRLDSCSNVVVDGIFTRRNSGYGVSPYNCDHCTFNNVKIFDWAQYGDGLDPDGCRNILINDCFFMAADDQIAIKSDPRSHAATRTDSITVSNTITHVMPGGVGDGTTIGFELDADRVANILIKGCDFLRSVGGGGTGGHSGFSVVLAGKAKVRNIRFEDIRCEEDTDPKNFELCIMPHWSYNNGLGDIQGVYLKNITWDNANRPIVIRGYDATHLVQDVIFDNCYYGKTLLTAAWAAANPKLFQANQFTKNITFIAGGTESNRLQP